MTSAELRAAREAIVLEHFRAENAHDIEGVLATFENPRYEMMHLGRSHDGADEVQDLISGIFRGLPDIHAEPGRLRHMEDAVFVECITTGTHDGFFAGLPPTGKKIEARSACVFEFEEERLQCERVYLDLATILRQLGALAPLPDRFATPSRAD
jgi:steroid delta-isomerase-like uncharacterized protein